MGKKKVILNSLLFSVPAFILVIPGAGEAPFAIISLWSMLYCHKEKINPFKCEHTKLFSFIVIAYFFTSFLSVIASDPSLYAFKRLGTNFHFLVAPWLAAFLLKKLTFSALSRSVKVGAICAGLVALVQYFYFDRRAGGVVNEIIFGDISLLLAFFALINLFNESAKEKVFSLLSFSLGLSAVIFSLSRGAWVVAPILFPVLIFIWHKQEAISKSSLIAICMLATVIIISTASLSPQVQSRFKLMNSEITEYKDTNFTSIGARITLWKAALHVFPNHPIFGYGLHNTKLAASDFFQSEKSKNSIAYYDHFHNEYLNTLVGKGLIGFLGLLVILFVPIRFFLKSIKYGTESNYAALGIILCIGYIFFGLTNITFGHGILNTFFVFVLAACNHAFYTTSQIEIKE